MPHEGLFQPLHDVEERRGMLVAAVVPVHALLDPIQPRTLNPKGLGRLGQHIVRQRG